MTNTYDDRIADLADRLGAVRARIADDKIAESDLLAQIRQAIGNYRGTLVIADQPVLTATYRKTFSVDEARKVLNDELIEACSETVISAAKAKQILAPAIYELCQVESSQATIK